MISDFIRRYVREQDYYARVSELCGRRLESLLRQANIRAITSWRAKRPDRLHKKLEDRNEARKQRGREPYSSDEEIYDDVPDLAGVRVALYFPSDRAAVRRLIEDNFQLTQAPKTFPTPTGELSPEAIKRRQYKRFPGYSAEHYRARLRDTLLSGDERRYADGRCEIQVASVLMHAWSEVEHDLEYKDLSGPVSEIESVLLDQINGLVIAGEIALEQLQRATVQRSSPANPAKLRDQYDLANWLSTLTATNEPVGRADLAHRLLERLGLTSSEHLAALAQLVLSKIAQVPSLPPAEALVEAIIEQDPSREAALVRAKADIAAADALTAPAESESTAVDELALGIFLSRWRILEQTAMQLGQLASTAGRPIHPVSILSQVVNFDEETATALRSLQALRSRAVHATGENPSIQELLDGSLQLNRILSNLPASAKNDSARRSIDAALKLGGFSRTGEDSSTESGIVVFNPGIGILFTERHLLAVPFEVHNTSDSADAILRVVAHVGQEHFFTSQQSLPIATPTFGPTPVALAPREGMQSLSVFLLSPSATTIVATTQDVLLELSTQAVKSLRRQTAVGVVPAPRARWP